MPQTTPPSPKLSLTAPSKAGSFWVGFWGGLCLMCQRDVGDDAAEDTAGQLPLHVLRPGLVL